MGACFFYDLLAPWGVVGSLGVPVSDPGDLVIVYLCGKCGPVRKRRSRSKGNVSNNGGCHSFKVRHRDKKYTMDNVNVKYSKGRLMMFLPGMNGGRSSMVER
jgi:hypothetical protein